MEMIGVAKRLAELGHEITSNWIWNQEHHDDGETADGGVGPIMAAHYAELDRHGIFTCDTMICFTDGTPARGGRHVEFGIALTIGKRLILVGPMENIFHFLPFVEHHDRLENLMDALTYEQNKRGTTVGVEQKSSTLFENGSGALDAIRGR
jgi:hypothetical protein